MKIDDISLTIFAWDGIPSTIYHQGSLASSSSNLGLLRIHTDAGLEGHAFLGSASNPGSMDGAQLIRSLKPMLMGQNPLERERIHAAMRLVSRTVSYRTVGAVDTALWDLAGKIAGLPVHALMGTCRNSIPAYASSQVLPDAAAYVDQAQEFKSKGWQAYKIHPPRDPDHDIKVSSKLHPCFLAVERTDRIVAKSSAPCSDRKPPETLMTPLIFDSCITMPKQARLSWTPLFVSGWVT